MDNNSEFFSPIAPEEAQDAQSGTAAKTRVLIESSDATSTWRTVGVSENILEASYQALVDSIEYKLLRDREAD